MIGMLVRLDTPLVRFKGQGHRLKFRVTRGENVADVGVTSCDCFVVATALSKMSCLLACINAELTGV